MQIFHLQKAGMERHERLRIARERHFTTMKDAADSLGVPYGTYSGHEAGSRGFKVDELVLYARRFHVSRAWLAFGDGEMDPIVSLGEGPAIDRSAFAQLAHVVEDTMQPPRKVYIQVELERLRSLVSGALQNESIPEEQADAYAAVVLGSLTNYAQVSLVLHSDDAPRIGVVSQDPEADDRP